MMTNLNLAPAFAASEIASGLSVSLWGMRLEPLEVLMRLAAAILAGAVIGLDREWRRRSAGLRTHMLIALASAAFTIIAFEIYADVQDLDEQDSVDPLRLLEAITAGVAFLAAGAIIRANGDVKGVTTGASMWLAGALGMACGQAMYGVAALAAGLALIILVVLRYVERPFAQGRSGGGADEKGNHRSSDGGRGDDRDA